MLCIWSVWLSWDLQGSEKLLSSRTSCPTVFFLFSLRCSLRRQEKDVALMTALSSSTTSLSRSRSLMCLQFRSFLLWPPLLFLTGQTGKELLSNLRTDSSLSSISRLQVCILFQCLSWLRITMLVFYSFLSILEDDAGSIDRRKRQRYAKDSSLCHRK